MSIDATVTKTASGSWLFTWPVGTAPYKIWLDGEVLESALATESYDFVLPGYEDAAPPLEILNAADPVGNSLYPPRFTLQWRGMQSAHAYIPQEWNGSAWVDMTYILEDGLGYYSWTSDPLTDQATHLFRVVATNIHDQEGTPLAFTSDVTRNPNTPSTALTIAAGDVVVSAA